MKHDKRSVGGLVTTHKIDLFEACRDLIDEVDHYAELCGEASGLAVRDGRLLAFATDPVSSARALDEFFPPPNNAEVLCLGGGGSATAITVQMLERRIATRVTVVDKDAARLLRIETVHQKLDPAAEVRYVESRDATTNDRLVTRLPAGSIVINATGLGKDLPGSPITSEAVFPEEGYAWDLNYRGDLEFLDQARKQQDARHLHVEDGWRYFIHGWAVVMGRVFDIDIDQALTERLANVSR
jgi:shikimate 5-dehydrogenase